MWPELLNGIVEPGFFEIDAGIGSAPPSWRRSLRIYLHPI